MKRKRATPKKPPSKEKTIYLVGEGTGETINKIAKASLSQFSSENVDVKTFFQVTTEDQIHRIAKEAAQDKALVAFSVVQAPLRDFLIKEADRSGIQAIDVIGDLSFISPGSWAKTPCRFRDDSTHWTTSIIVESKRSILPLNTTTGNCLKV